MQIYIILLVFQGSVASVQGRTHVELSLQIRHAKNIDEIQQKLNQRIFLKKYSIFFKLTVSKKRISVQYVTD